MTDRDGILRRALHDVSKYLTRAARNIPPDLEPVPEVLLRMLVDDLYLTDGTRRASQVFDTLAAPLAGEAAVDGLRSLLVRIDELEPAVRAADPSAVRAAVELALQFDAQLRELI